MRRLLLLGIAVCLVGSSLRAQDTLSSRPSAVPCSYDACALRIEAGRVLRGAQGVEVGRFGFWRVPRLVPLVGPSDSARFYAAEFDRHYARGSRWSLVGTVAGGVATAYLIDRHYHPAATDQWRGGDWGALGGLVVAFAASTYGDRQLTRARRGLSRAIWWHNRELSR